MKATKLCAAALAAVLSVSVLLAGCGGTPSSSASAPVGSGSEGAGTAVEPVKLVYMTTQKPEVLKELTDRYKTVAPNVEIEFIQLPSDNTGATTDQNIAKLDAAIASGQVIDLCDLGAGGTGVIRPRALNGMLIPLDEFIEKQGITMEEEFIKGSEFTCAFGEGESKKWYTLPMSRTIYPVYYNRTMFKEAGIADPEWDWTYDDLREIAQKLTSGEGVNKVFGSWIPVDWGWFAGVPAQMAGWEAYREENGQKIANFDSPALKKAIETYYTMSVVDESNPTATEISLNKLNMSDYFAEGKTAMIVGNPWCLPELQKAKAAGQMDFELGIAPMPRVLDDIPKDVCASEIAGGMFIPKTSANPEEAFNFMRFCALDCADIYRSLPASVKADTDAIVNYLGTYVDENGTRHENLFTEEELKYLLEENREGFKSYYSMKEDEFIGPLWGVLGTEVNNVMTNAKTVDQAIADMNTEGQKEIDKLVSSAG